MKGEPCRTFVRVQSLFHAWLLGSPLPYRCILLFACSDLCQDQWERTISPCRWIDRTYAATRWQLCLRAVAPDSILIPLFELVEAG